MSKETLREQTRLAFENAQHRAVANGHLHAKVGYTGPESLLDYLAEELTNVVTAESDRRLTEFARDAQARLAKLDLGRLRSGNYTSVPLADNLEAIDATLQRYIGDNSEN